MPVTTELPEITQNTLSVSERTYQALLDRIVARDIPAGEVLEERRLSESMDVSRTPLRAALNRLLGEGILTRLSNGSIMVRSFGATELVELLQVRRLLESEAAGMAVGRIPGERLAAVRERLEALIGEPDVALEADWAIDNEVHDLIATHCGNKSMAAIIADARRRVRMCNVERMPGRALHARHEHLAIVVALQSGNASSARETMAAHLDNVRNTFMKTMGFLSHA